MTLTPAMRAYLGQQWLYGLLYDVLLGFMRKFELTPLEAGTLVAQWIVETM
jgi:hypothetical protein